MDADEYFALTKLGMKQCMTQLKEQGINPGLIKGIMGDGIIYGIVGIYENGKEITPYINYLDSRTQSDAATLKELNLEIWGNKRVGIAVMLLLLKLNGYTLTLIVLVEDIER